MADPKVTLTLSQLAALLKPGAPPPTVLERFLLRTVKIPGQNVRQLAQLYSLAQSIVDAMAKVNAAIGTVTALLEFVGILKAKDPFAETRAFIQGLFDQFFDYLEGEVKQQQDEKRTKWSTAVDRAQAALDGLNVSRAQAPFNEAVEALNGLMKLLSEMMTPVQDTGLADTLPSAGIVPFVREAYSYPPEIYSETPDHWLSYAAPALMMTKGTAPGLGRPLQYNLTSDNLARRIWDAGFYIDLLLSGLSYFTSVLSAIEPAFRATGYRRRELYQLARLLGAFASGWERSLFITRIDSTLVPSGIEDGRAYINHPYANPYLAPFHCRGIPLGVVDPVSGIAAFTPAWDEQFEFGDIRLAPDPIQGWIDERRIVTNYDHARLVAEDALEDAVDAIKQACGIRTLNTIRAKLVELADYPRTGSVFTKIERSTSSRQDPKAWPSLEIPQVYAGAPEKISLGDIGVKAGKPGKLYDAVRYFDARPRRLRIPMARRSDASRIQLGYRMTVKAGGSKADGVNLVLCEFHSPSDPWQEDLALFPVGAKVDHITVEDATVYDVVQSGLFTLEDEERYEEGSFAFEKQRLLLNPRPGHVAVDVAVDFEFDLDDPAHPFMGHALVELTNLDSTEGFILLVQVYETVNVPEKDGAGTYTGKEIKTELLADTMTVHFAPSYLVPEEAYFVDRLAGLAVFNKSLLDIRRTYDLASKPWENPPQEHIWRHRDIAWSQARVVEEVIQFEQLQPEAAKGIVARYQSPKERER